MPKGCVSHNFKDITNQRFGYLTVIKRMESNKNGGSRWLCSCDCGGQTIAGTGDLNNGHTNSCGCFQSKQVSKAQSRHRMAIPGEVHPLYTLWQNMKNRCSNANDKCFKNYGKRGISVHPSWEYFGVFKNWARNAGWRKDLTIERIDNDGNYEPDNCTFIKRCLQARNRRNTILNMEAATAIRYSYYVMKKSVRQISNVYKLPMYYLRSVINNTLWREGLHYE